MALPDYAKDPKAFTDWAHDRDQLAAPVKGRKDDGGKLDMTLLDDMPRALEAVVEVMQWAITKKAPVPYVRSSWLGVSPERYDAAILRHHFGAAKQAAGHGPGSDVAPPKFQRDAETNLLHAAHKATSAMFALELALRELEKING